MKEGIPEELMNGHHYLDYDPDQGLSFTLDSIRGLNFPLHTAAFCTFNPPADYYKTQSLQGCLICSNVDIESSMSNPNYKMEEYIFKSISTEDHKQLLIDLYGITSEEGKPGLLNIGWTILPIFQPLGDKLIINNGLYQVLYIKQYSYLYLHHHYLSSHYMN